MGDRLAMISPTRMVLVLTALCLLVACGASAGRLRTLPPGHSGAFTTWWTDEVPKERGEYLNGERHGEVQVFHRTGALAMEGRFERGVPVGEIDYHRAEGGRDRTVTWAGGQLAGPHIKYHPSGQIALQTHYAGGLPDGPERSFHPDGSLRHEGRWSRGLRAGHWRHLAPDGRVLREEHHFVADGRESGYLETVYDEQGRATIQTLMVRQGDTQRGWVSEWHPEGGQSALVEYRDGRRHGRDVSWSPTGVTLREGQLENDLRVGTWRWWDEHGRLTRQARYEDGREVGADEPAAP